MGNSKGIGVGCSGATRSDEGLGRGRWDDRWGASSETGAASITVARGKATAFGALIEVAVLLLMTLTAADKAGIIESWMGWEKGGVGLVEKGLSMICSLLGFLGAQAGDLFLVGKGRRWRGNRERSGDGSRRESSNVARGKGIQMELTINVDKDV